jgi:hypothetical protein
MELKSISYKENVGKENTNPWKLNNLILGNQNLIIAKNATGKTRILGVIYNLAKLMQDAPSDIGGIAPKNLSFGEWNVTFDDKGSHVVYLLAIDKGKVVHESLTIDGKKMLNRQNDLAEIYSHEQHQMYSIAPPDNRLVLHVRRDQKEFPFLESLASWANGVRGLSFANTTPYSIEIPGNPFQLMSLNAVPSALDQLSDQQLNTVLRQLNELDYNIEQVSTGHVDGLPPTTKVVFLKERMLSIPLKQFEISQGMFRAFSLLVIIEFFQGSGKIGSLLIDDLGEGLDFDRCQKLAKIIFEKNNHSKLQIITTSNDSFLMNSVSLNDLTVCYRMDHSVECLNYANAKDKFDEWQTLGLNNFDLLSSNFLVE